MFSRALILGLALGAACHRDRPALDRKALVGSWSYVVDDPMVTQGRNDLELHDDGTCADRFVASGQPSAPGFHHGTWRVEGSKLYTDCMSDNGRGLEPTIENDALVFLGSEGKLVYRRAARVPSPP